MPRLTVLIASYLEPEHVERIRAVDPVLDVAYEPDLLPRPRYAADHFGALLERAPERERRWRTLLAAAEVLFDFDYTHTADLPDLAPRVRWIQATSAGIGQFVERHRYAARMPSAVFTTASGVHARPLAEFCALAMLAVSRKLFVTLEAQQGRRWERFAGTDLLGRTVLIYGHGRIGREVARVARAFGMRAIGVKRSIEGASAEALGVDEIHAASALPELLPRADFLVLSAPHTPETDGAIGPRELERLKPGCFLINISRGALVDEPALVAALGSGRLAGAALDVFREEPLPSGSPLWSLPNVLVSPHSASTSDRENGLITDLFCSNLRRFLKGEPLENVLDVARLY